MIKLLALYKEGSYTDYHGSFCLIFTQVRHILDRTARSFLFSIAPLNASLTQINSDLTELSNATLLKEFTNTNPTSVALNDDVNNYRELLLLLLGSNGQIYATSRLPLDLYKSASEGFLAHLSEPANNSWHYWVARAQYVDATTAIVRAYSSYSPNPAKGQLYGIK